MSRSTDVIIIGAGAAGLMCAIEAGKRGRSVLLLEAAEKIGKKILISGGGRCNFTNVGAVPERYLSQNPHFVKSALARYTPSDFVSLIEKHGVAYHEKKLGQLFCDESARQIVALLRRECEENGVEIVTKVVVEKISKSEEVGFQLQTSTGELSCDSLVIATGGISIPKMGASPFGYQVAEQFALSLVERKPGLVPLIFSTALLEELDGLSGISIDAEVSCRDALFRENVLITHRGVSGPAILQISSYWSPGETIELNLLPDIDLSLEIEHARQERPKQMTSSLVAEHLPTKFVDRVFDTWLVNKPLGQLSKSEIRACTDFFHGWPLRPDSTEGYRTAEVTVGGVDTNELSSKTFEAKKVPGLYFIGEVVDVTGWLGGYNFQWAWASGYCCGQEV